MCSIEPELEIRKMKRSGTAHQNRVCYWKRAHESFPDGFGGKQNVRLFNGTNSSAFLVPMCGVFLATAGPDVRTGCRVVLRENLNRQRQLGQGRADERRRYAFYSRNFDKCRVSGIKKRDARAELPFQSSCADQELGKSVECIGIEDVIAALPRGALVRPPSASP